MNKCKTSYLSALARSIFLALCSLSAVEAGAQVEEGRKVDSAQASGNISETHGDGEVILTVLTDQVHTLKAILKSDTANHYYGFKVVRGQKVLLSAPDSEAFIDIEYLDGEQWRRSPAGGLAFSGLKPGSEIMVRVSHKKTVPFTSRSYELIFGSYPVLKKFQLHDEMGVNRMPPGHTEPRFLWTQGYTGANLEAYFTDTTGAPLKGAVGRFNLNLEQSRLSTVHAILTSDSAGRVVKNIKFRRCSGGREARDHVSYYRGSNTWRSNYYSGTYTFSNHLLGDVAELEAAKASRTFGHICKQRLIKSVPGPA
ncbi:hypothetical protein [Pseudomonas bohemica]|uniref:hypothetical protein n=1 Tax=Pseudomonas bohemica TaxID=2044872 RepID=UPI000DA63978|nr:hypothetical protein [Pseudomonas bohemica]